MNTRIIEMMYKVIPDYIFTFEQEKLSSGNTHKTITKNENVK